MSDIILSINTERLYHTEGEIIDELYYQTDHRHLLNRG